GESAVAKLGRVQKAIQEKEAAGLFVCAPDNVAWLFNIRGRDVIHTPLPLVRAYVPASGRPVLFVSPGHVTAGNKEAIEETATIEPLASLPKSLPALIEPGAKVLIDPSQTTLTVESALRASKAALVETSDPIGLFKAKKNKTELEGA